MRTMSYMRVLNFSTAVHCLMRELRYRPAKRDNACMLAVVSWKCDCGMNVKAMYETGGKTSLRCPESLCKNIHDVEGEITELWIKDDSTDWRPQEVRSLIVH